MDIHIILYNAETDKTHFTLHSGTRPYAILLGISKGSFRLSFPQMGYSKEVFPDEMVYIPANTEFLREVIEPIDFHQFSFSVGEESGYFQQLAPGKLNIPKEQTRAIMRSADMIAAFPTETERLAKEILHKITVDNYLFSRAASVAHLSPEVLAASRYIQQHPEGSLSVSDLAESLHLPHNGLIWKFNRELNMSPKQYIQLCRINRAKELLLDGDLPVSRIAELCGYSNMYYFSNAFKKSEGMSPSAYRRKRNEM